MRSEASERADFSGIRYAQCWEDSDVLLAALEPGPGKRCLSIASAGDNTFEIRNGRAIANGKDGGPLKAGDSVLLDKEGRLLVNGQERTTK